MRRSWRVLAVAVALASGCSAPIRRTSVPASFAPLLTRLETTSSDATFGQLYVGRGIAVGVNGAQAVAYLTLGQSGLWLLGVVRDGRLAMSASGVDVALVIADGSASGVLQMRGQDGSAFELPLADGDDLLLRARSARGAVGGLIVSDGAVTGGFVAQDTAPGVTTTSITPLLRIVLTRLPFVGFQLLASATDRRGQCEELDDEATTAANRMRGEHAELRNTRVPGLASERRRLERRLAELKQKESGTSAIDTTARALEHVQARAAATDRVVASLHQGITVMTEDVAAELESLTC